jgi:hypothetical protein
LRDDPRVPRPLRGARARGDRAAPARQPGRAEPRGPALAEDGQRLSGCDARDIVGAALGARRPALRLSGQASRAPPRDDRGGGRGARAVHDRDPDRDRGDARRADRVAGRDPRARRALRPRPGSDRSELPREAGHQDGRRTGARARRAAVDGSGGACRPRFRLEHPGPAEPELCGLSSAARGGHQRLGRGLAGHDRPREPGGAVARDRGAAGGDRVARAHAGAAAVRVSGVRGRRRALARPRGRAARSPTRRCRRPGARGDLGGRRRRAPTGRDPSGHRLWCPKPPPRVDRNRASRACG